jgi:hypothetical protein
MIPVVERAKTVHALARAAIIIGHINNNNNNNNNDNISAVNVPRRLS